MIKCRVFLVLLSMFLILGSFTGCKKNEVIKIGLLMDLSGRASSMGIDGRNAAEIAFESYNLELAKQNKKIELVIKDGSGDAAAIETILGEFQEEGVQVIIGPLTSSVASTVFENKAFINKELLFLSPTVSSSTFSDQDDHFITLIDVNEKQGQLLGEKATVDHIYKCAIVYEETNSIYTVPLVTAFREALLKGGGRITYDNQFISSEDAPFEKMAKDIVAGDPDGVLISAGDVDTASLCQYLYKLDPELKIYSGLWAKTGDFIQNGGKSVEGAILTSTFDTETPQIIDFAAQYSTKFGKDPSFSAIHNYAAAEILINAIEEGISFDSKHIKAYIVEKGSFDSITGRIHIDPFGDCEQEYLLVEITDGGYKKVETNE